MQLTSNVHQNKVSIFDLQRFIIKLFIKNGSSRINEITDEKNLPVGYVNELTFWSFLE